jgi:phosphonate transport system ATP-binding protein
LLLQAEKVRRTLPGDETSRVAADEDSQLRVSCLFKSFRGRGAVLEDISFRALRKEAVALIGGNGSGKSTLLRCCLRLIEPDRGDILLLNEHISSLGGSRLRRLRSRVGLVFQQHNLVPQLSVLTNVVHGALGRSWGLLSCFQGLAPKRLREEAMTCLEKVGLPHLAASRASELSGGESQRVAIARALMQRPHLMMADEPVASLDPKVGREVMELFIRLIEQENLTLIYVSHDLDHALHYSDKLLGLRQGKLVLDGYTSDYTKGDLHEIYN